MPHKIPVEREVYRRLKASEHVRGQFEMRFFAEQERRIRSRDALCEKRGDQIHGENAESEEAFEVEICL